MRRDWGNWACLVWRRLRGDSSTHINIPKVDAKSMVPDSSVVPSDWMGNGPKLKHRKFHLSMGKNFTFRVAERWSRLLRKVMGSPTLEAFKTCLDTFLCQLLQLTLPWQRDSDLQMSMQEVTSSPARVWDCRCWPCNCGLLELQSIRHEVLQRPLVRRRGLVLENARKLTWHSLWTYINKIIQYLLLLSYLAPAKEL